MKKKQLKERIKILEWQLKEARETSGDETIDPQIIVTTMLIENVSIFATADIVSEFPLQSAVEQIKQLVKDKGLNLNYFTCECSGCYGKFHLKKFHYDLEDLVKNKMRYRWEYIDPNAALNTLRETNYSKQDRPKSKQAAIIAALLETGAVFCFQAKEDYLDYLKVANNGNNLLLFEKYKEQERFPKVIMIKLERKATAIKEHPKDEDLVQTLKAFSVAMKAEI